jgi:hypothetical protein
MRVNPALFAARVQDRFCKANRDLTPAFSSAIQRSVVRSVNTVGVRCAYRLVSAGCSSLQLVATMIRPICSLFQFVATGCSLLSGTFNPEVAGSNPARPMTNSLQIATSRVRCRARRRGGRTECVTTGCCSARLVAASCSSFQLETGDFVSSCWGRAETRRCRKLAGTNVR